MREKRDTDAQLVMKAIEHIAAEKSAAEEAILQCIQDFEAETTLRVDDVLYFTLEVANYQGAPPPPITQEITLRLRRLLE